MVKSKNLISILFGVLSLLYYPFGVAFDEKILKIAKELGSKYGLYFLYNYELIITGSIFILFAILGIIFGIKARKSGEKLLSTIGVALSFLGLLIVIGFVSFIYLVGRFWGG
jgi:uncharacterized membrane protein